MERVDLRELGDHLIQLDIGEYSSRERDIPRSGSSDPMPDIVQGSLFENRLNARGKIFQFERCRQRSFNLTNGAPTINVSGIDDLSIAVAY